MEALPPSADVRVFEVGQPVPPHRTLGMVKVPLALWEDHEHALEIAKDAARERGANGLIVMERPGAFYENKKSSFLLIRIEP